MTAIHGPNLSRTRLLLLTLVCEGGLALLAWIIGGLFDSPPHSMLHFDAADAALGAAASLPVVAVFVLLVRLPLRPCMRIRVLCQELIRPLFAACSWFELLLISAMAGYAEELLFRGTLQALASQWTGPLVALISVSALFGLLHPFTVTYTILAAAIGAYFGLLWMASGNLLTPMVAHGLYDFIILCALVKRPNWSLGEVE
jgi:membrane protease YdiL (CAAX protease family)